MQGITEVAPRSLMAAAFLVVIFWGISEARNFLIPVSLAALLAFMMAPVVRMMHRYHFPEWSAIAVSSIFLVLPFMSLISILIWQGQALANDFPEIAGTVNRILLSLVQSEWWNRFHLPVKINVSALLSRLEGSIAQGVQFALAGLGAVLGAGSQVALVLLFSVLMLSSRLHLRTSFERILDRCFSIQNPGVLDEVVGLVEQFLVARFLIMLIIGVVDTLILKGFGIRYSFLMGSFLGITTAIPAIGFLIGLIPPLLVYIATGHSLLGTLFGVSIVEGNILSPKMVGKRLNINALATFLGLFGGGLMWGIWGMFLSIPLLGILRITFNRSPEYQPWGDLLAEKDRVL